MFLCAVAIWVLYDALLREAREEGGIVFSFFFRPLIEEGENAGATSNVLLLGA